MTARARARNGRAPSLLPAVALVATLAASVAAHAAEPEAAPHLDELVERALAEGLEHDLTWHALLHYAPDWFGGGVTSHADGAELFLAPDGKTDPRAELVATLAAFLEPPEPGAREHPQCRFPARRRWLDERLGFDEARLPRQPCPELERWWGLLDPKGLTLIFPEAYLNNPASAFGHTLLRVDSTAPGTDTDLTAFSVNFGAEAGGDPGVIYALKGIFGLYPGYFSIEPYYDKVEEYGDWENRDIWEYPLDLSDEEVRRILEHVWELRGVAFDYYYFDENCSLVLLRLLQVARPEAPLDPRVVLPWVFPVETVQVALDMAGRPDAIRFRPSPASELAHAAATQSAPVLDAAVALSSGRIEPDDASLDALDAASRARALSLATLDLRYRTLAEEVDRPTAVGRTRRLLVALSRAPERPRAEPVPRPASRPDQGHPPPRIAFGGGWDDTDAFVELALRSCFHELLDPGAGFIPGAGITFLEGALRYYPGEERLRFHEFTLLEITSLAPRNVFLSPISWRLRTGFETRALPRGRAGADALRREPVGRADGGAGLAYDLVPGLRAYGFAEAVAEVGSDLEGDVALGPGASAGLLIGGREDGLAARLHGDVTGYVVGDTTTRYRGGLELRATLPWKDALRLDLGYERVYGEDRFHAELALHVFLP